MANAAAFVASFATRGMGRAFRHRDFTLFALSGWIANMGMWLQRIGVQWLTWEITGSYGWLGAMAFADAMGIMSFLPISGILADRAPLNLLLCLSAGLLCVSMIVLHQAEAESLPHLIGVLMGAGAGVSIAVNQPLVVRYFGRRHLGKILGAGATIMVAASSFGPFLLGLTYDLAGSYQPAVRAFAIVAGVMTPLGLLGTPPHRSRQGTEG